MRWILPDYTVTLTPLTPVLSPDLVSVVVLVGVHLDERSLPRNESDHSDWDDLCDVRIVADHGFPDVTALSAGSRIGNAWSLSSVAPGESVHAVLEVFNPLQRQTQHGTLLQITVSMTACEYRNHRYDQTMALAALRVVSPAAYHETASDAEVERHLNSASGGARSGRPSHALAMRRSSGNAGSDEWEGPWTPELW
jgi:hypothetical protein